MKVAVIGIGSNSVRMLMAKLDGTHAWKLRRDRIGTRLFAGLDEKKNLSGDAMAVSAGAVADFADIARFEGADEVRLFATSATRDAANQADISEIMEASAKAAAASCQDDGTCGFVWTDSKFDNDTGVGQQMNALNVLTGLLASNATGSQKEAEGVASGTATGTAPSATGTNAASGTATGPPTVSQTGAASSFGVAHAVWGVGALALGFAALL